MPLQVALAGVHVLPMTPKLKLSAHHLCTIICGNAAYFEQQKYISEWSKSHDIEKIDQAICHLFSLH